MSAPTDRTAQVSTRRSAREALDRWLAEADALLAGEASQAVAPALPGS